MPSMAFDSRCCTLSLSVTTLHCTQTAALGAAHGYLNLSSMLTANNPASTIKQPSKHCQTTMRGPTQGASGRQHQKAGADSGADTCQCPLLETQRLHIYNRTVAVHA
jgi:hypothetical protein